MNGKLLSNIIKEPFGPSPHKQYNYYKRRCRHLLLNFPQDCFILLYLFFQLNIATVHTRIFIHKKSKKEVIQNAEKYTTWNELMV